MPFLNEEKINWKQISFLVILVLIVVGIILDYQRRVKIESPQGEIKTTETPKEIEEEKLELEEKEEIKEKEEVEEESVEIFPFEADVKYCRDSKEKEYPATGTGSAKWFLWGGCASWKSYNVSPGKELVLHIFTDSCAGCVCYYPNFYVFEFKDGQWKETKYFDLPDKKGTSENVFYVPSSDKIKILAKNCFYLEVFSGKLEEIEKKLNQKIELKQKNAEDLLNEFLKARMENEREKALGFLTENARYQYERGTWKLTDPNFSSYNIVQVRKIDETRFKFVVEIAVKEQPGPTVEIIDVIEILGNFFIDSVQLPG